LKLITSALIMWLHPSPLLLPPRICHHTTPASFKCPGSTLGMKPLSCEYNRAKRAHISSKLGPLLMVVSLVFIWFVCRDYHDPIKCRRV
ncbi:hypothetical protein EJB05_29803, partial [Eragrostis curvula]